MRSAAARRVTHIFFSNWSNVGIVVLRVAIAYGVIVAIFRIVGEQALAKMRAYDLIVSITLGELVASIPFLDHFALFDGVVAIFAFVGLQELIRYAQSRSKKIRDAVVEEPRVVVWNGKMLEDRLERWHLRSDEVRAAIRRHGGAALEDIQAVVLENDGEWSVVERSEGSEHGSAFHGLDLPR